ncbi:MAG: hypothetical protein BAJATHORv1_40184 [Candidatus Thorarchaeota archaeon]|nr:MAG: hypothetical protein BAJATHORv1_40184 [Candidatus Thorarchaeota archaeon]
MSNEIEDLAKSVLLDIGHSIQDTLVENRRVNRTVSEAVRIASLIYSLSMFQNRDALELVKSKRMPFLSLSYPAQQNGISIDQVVSLVRDLLDQDIRVYNTISELTTLQYIELLHRIHSLGVFNPIMLRKTKTQRKTGSVYTPYSLAKHIVKLTINPLVKKYSSPSSIPDFLSIRILDPACGPGMFLVALYLEFCTHIKHVLSESLATHEKLDSSQLVEIKGGIARNLFGVDLDKASLEIADVALSLLSDVDLMEESAFLDKTLKQGNSLISISGLDGGQDYSSFFSDPLARLPFEWRSEYTTCFQRGDFGFDCIVMNPPYNRLKPNLAEFLREKLVIGEREIQMSSFDAFKSQLAEDVGYFRNSGEYQLANKYTLDTYRLFVERAIQLLRPSGYMGFIVPSTLLGDLSAKMLRKYIFSHTDVDTIEIYVEQAGLFEQVTQSVCILTTQLGSPSQNITLKFDGTELGKFSSQKFIKLSTEEIRQVSGSSMVVPQVTRDGLGILKKIHRHPSLGQLRWVEIFRGELDLTNNSSFIQDHQNDTPLIRGANIDRFRIDLDSIEHSVNFEFFSEWLKGSRRHPHLQQQRIACQQISNRAQRWRLKFAKISPNSILANSCNYIAVSNYNPSDYLDYLLGLLNSSLLNWRFALSNTNNHVSNRELAALPVVNPVTATANGTKLIQQIIDWVREHTSNRIDTVPLDILVFRLFGLDPNEAKVILTRQNAGKSEMSEIISSLIL